MEPIGAHLIVLSKINGVTLWDAEFYCGCSVCRSLSSSYSFSFFIIEVRPRITSPVIVVGSTRLSRYFRLSFYRQFILGENTYEFHCARHFHS
jgi:hypothetical protein